MVRYFVWLSILFSLNANARNFTFMNQCKQNIWVGALGKVIPNGGGWQLPPGGSNGVVLPDGWSGRFWGRTACSPTTGTCITGDCGHKIQCNGSGGQPPATLAEFTLNGSGGKDFYDLSLVDGYNLPMSIRPSNGVDLGFQCGTPSCVSDLNLSCPSVLQKKDASGTVVACMSACEKFNTDPYCCRGSFGTSETCPPTSYSQIFKSACPTAYSYAYDDKSSTFTCKGSDYVITFCPTGVAPSPSPTPTPPPPPLTGPIATVASPQLCVDVRAASSNDGTPVQLYPCNGTAAQQWSYNNENLQALGKCMSNSGNRVINGNLINLWNCHNGPDQKWVKSGLNIQLKGTNKCLDVTKGLFMSGTQLQIWDCQSGNRHQQFN